MAGTEETEGTSSGGVEEGQRPARGALASWHEEEGWTVLLTEEPETAAKGEKVNQHWKKNTEEEKTSYL